MDIKPFYKKYIEPFVAIGILIMLIFLGISLSNEHKLKQEISENCGWGGEDYVCYCKQSDVWEIEQMLSGSLEVPNVKLAG